MRKMQERIDALQEDAQRSEGDSAYCSAIVQLKFNAWHYIDTNLWASLTSEVLQGLAAAVAQKQGNDSEHERARVLAKVGTSSRNVIEEAERHKSKAEAILADKKRYLRHLQEEDAEVDKSISPLVKVRDAFRLAFAQPEAKEKIDQLSEMLNLGDSEKAAVELKRQVLEVQGDGNAIWRSIRKTTNLPICIGVWLGIIISLEFAIWYVGADILDAGLRRLLSNLAPILVLAVGVLNTVLPFLKRVRQIIGAARKANDKLIAKKRAEIAQELDAVRREIKEAEKAVNQLQLQIEDLRADGRAAKYIRQRSESNDYRQHLGIIALARTDFSRISTLLSDSRREAEQELQSSTDDSIGTRKPLFPRIDRIILYIDDLDRCPEDKVVDVLQAVHMLLAFPLFVVVVGVDSRWLLHSLAQQSRTFREGILENEGLSEAERKSWRSTPLSYLEKIFQIPYTLRPMGAAGFGELIDSLTMQKSAPSNQPPTPQTEGQSGPIETAIQPVAPVLRDGAASQQASESKSVQGQETIRFASTPATSIDRHPPQLHIDGREKEFMKCLHGFMPSPRAAKRFVNLYRLIRASVPDSELKAFSDEYQVVLLLLAILTGFPTQATEVLGTLGSTAPGETWWKFIDSLTSVSVGSAELGQPIGRSDNLAGEPPLRGNASDQMQSEEWTKLRERLSQIRHLIPESQPNLPFIKWAPRVARYSFQSGRLRRS